MDPLISFVHAHLWLCLLLAWCAGFGFLWALVFVGARGESECSEVDSDGRI